MNAGWNAGEDFSFLFEIEAYGFTTTNDGVVNFSQHIELFLLVVALQTFLNRFENALNVWVFLVWIWKNFPKL